MSDGVAAQECAARCRAWREGGHPRPRGKPGAIADECADERTGIPAAGRGRGTGEGVPGREDRGNDRRVAPAGDHSLLVRPREPQCGQRNSAGGLEPGKTVT